MLHISKSNDKHKKSGVCHRRPGQGAEKWKLRISSNNSDFGWAAHQKATEPCVSFRCFVKFIPAIILCSKDDWNNLGSEEPKNDTSKWILLMEKGKNKEVKLLRYFLRKKEERQLKEHQIS